MTLFYGLVRQILLKAFTNMVPNSSCSGSIDAESFKLAHFSLPERHLKVVPGVLGYQSFDHIYHCSASPSKGCLVA